MRLGIYDHLNETDPLIVPCTLQALVVEIRRLNYGEHRLLSELLRQREACADEKAYAQHREHTAMLRKMLEAGYY